MKDIREGEAGVFPPTMADFTHLRQVSAGQRGPGQGVGVGGDPGTTRPARPAGAGAGALFSLLDKDSDGQITKLEVVDFCATHGMNVAKLTKALGLTGRYTVNREHFLAVHSSGALDFLKGLGVDTGLIHRNSSAASVAAHPDAFDFAFEGEGEGSDDEGSDDDDDDDDEAFAAVLQGLLEDGSGSGGDGYDSNDDWTDEDSSDGALNMAAFRPREARHGHDDREVPEIHDVDGVAADDAAVLCFLLACRAQSTKLRASWGRLRGSMRVAEVRALRPTHGQFAQDWKPGFAGYGVDGLIVDDDGRLTDLYLAEKALRGRFPGGVSTCIHLSRVDLRGNELSGSVPDFSGLAHLTTLDLSQNQLTGRIPDFSGCHRLEELRLSGNRLAGPIPATWPYYLHTLHLQNNADLYGVVLKELVVQCSEILYVVHGGRPQNVSLTLWPCAPPRPRAPHVRPVFHATPTRWPDPCVLPSPPRRAARCQVPRVPADVAVQRGGEGGTGLLQESVSPNGSSPPSPSPDAV